MPLPELQYLPFDPVERRAGDERLPAIVFLHGSDEGGDGSAASLEKVKVHSLPCLAAAHKLPRVGGRAFPFFVAAPQAPSGWSSETDRIIDLLQILVERHGVDPRRCYLTGVSMGANACWAVAERTPHRFAAIVPVAGHVHDSAPVPTWIFAGAHDHLFKIEHVKEGVRKLRAAGAEVEFTCDPDAGHDGRRWSEFYARPDLYEWLLRHRL